MEGGGGRGDGGWEQGAGGRGQGERAEEVAGRREEGGADGKRMEEGEVEGMS